MKIGDVKMVDRFEKFIFMISEIDRFWHKIAADEMEKYGLKGPYVVYLVALNHHPEGITPMALAELCGRNKADVSRAMSDMREKGFVTKLASEGGVYRARLMLTEEGKAAAENICSIAARAVEFGGKGIDDEKRAVFYDILGLISENLKRLAEEGLN